MIFREKVEYRFHKIGTLLTMAFVCFALAAGTQSAFASDRYEGRHVSEDAETRYVTEDYYKQRDETRDAETRHVTEDDYKQRDETRDAETRHVTEDEYKQRRVTD